MEIYDFFLTIIIFILIGVIFLVNILSVGIKKVKENWPLYRCNPVVMPFAGIFDQDVTQNFSYCIQNLQISSMGDLLKPLNYANQVVGNTLQGIQGSVQYVREFFNKMRNFISDTISSIMGVFLNLLLGIFRAILYLLDLFGRLIGIVTIVSNIIAGSNDAGQSIWNGPPGQTARALGSLCFDKNNLIEKENGEIIKMKNIKLGDKLKGGNFVIAKLYLNNFINNEYQNKLYKIYNKKLDCYIKVTGNHLVFDKKLKEFVFVKNYRKSILCKGNVKKVFCMITSDHLICIGNEIYHDWEDNKDTLL